MHGNIANRIIELKRPNMPVVGDYATSYLYSDRNVHYIVAVEKEGKAFWTKDVKRCFRRPEYDVLFRVDNKGKMRITVKGISGNILVDDKLFLEKQIHPEFWLYVEDNNTYIPDKWVLLKDNKYHESHFDLSKRRYKTSIKNTVISPGVYDYYYDPSF
jgi:hypothetical protein